MKLLILVVFISLLIFIGKVYYDTNSIEIRHYQIENSSLGEVLNGLKVAHLSDLHIKTIGLKESKILEILKEEKPDLIFVTGDLISFKGPYEPFMSFLHQLKPPFGVYAVLGNTEYSNENGSCILCHKGGSKNLKEGQNPIFLRNSSIPLKINGKTLNIIGVDDPVDKKSDLKIALKNINSEDPSILLAHSPEIFEEASGFRIDFLLCGHTHGGQIFLTQCLRKIFPLEASLEFLEGFFQKGKMLTYVNRGIGTSYLPFRFGVKPEITFFTFSKSTNSINLSRPPCNEYVRGEIRSLFHWDRTNSLQISNTPPTTLFLGVSLSNIFDTFNLFASPHPSPLPLGKRDGVRGNSVNSNVLFDFESESDLKRLNWECHKWFELSKENATSGQHSLKVILPPGQYPGIDFQDIQGNWSKGNYLKMDIFNPSEDDLRFHIRIDDNKSGWEYADRFDINYELKRGMNHISVPKSSISTNIHHHPLNLKKIKRMMVFIPTNPQKREIYIDNIRLE